MTSVAKSMRLWHFYAAEITASCEFLGFLSNSSGLPSNFINALTLSIALQEDWHRRTRDPAQFSKAKTLGFNWFNCFRLGVCVFSSLLQWLSTSLFAHLSWLHRFVFTNLRTAVAMVRSSCPCYVRVTRPLHASHDHVLQKVSGMALSCNAINRFSLLFNEGFVYTDLLCGQLLVAIFLNTRSDIVFGGTATVSATFRVTFGIQHVFHRCGMSLLWVFRCKVIHVILDNVDPPQRRKDAANGASNVSN